ncbi:MAG: hypothetical protein MZU84_03290 [Sphingobacterium sp.]|nr:hypothetical protein [Sphingobacterium sp.]
MPYNTGNPIGSTDPRDLYDNAANLDDLINSRENLTDLDRFGFERKTWFGMEEEFNAAQQERANIFETFLQSTGYQYIGDYEAGIAVTSYTQVIRDPNGEFWRASIDTELPYTTTGAGMPEGGAFVAVGEATLRNDLITSPSDGFGALIVRGAVIYADSLPQLTALDDAMLVDGQVAILSNGKFYKWDSVKAMWVLCEKLWLNNEGSSDTESPVDIANFPGVNRRSFVVHHYNDGEMIVLDNVGENNVFALLRNARNTTRRPDKPDTFYGNADFLRCQNLYLYSGSYQSFNVFEVLYNGNLRWGNQVQNNGCVNLINAQLTHNSDYSFRLKTETANDKLLEITYSATIPAYQFNVVGGTQVKMSLGGATFTQGALIDVPTGRLDLTAKTGIIRLESQSQKDYYLKTSTGYAWMAKFVDSGSAPNTAGDWANSPGERGDIYAAPSGSHVYVCYAPNKWCRIAAAIS